MRDQPEKPESEILTPDEIRTVDFYGDEIAAAMVRVEGEEASVYVPLRLLCDYLGLSWSAQFERLKRDDVLSAAAKFVRMARTDEFVRMTRTNSRRGNPNLLCLPLKLLPGWLFGIETSRIKKPDLRERIILYRRECYDRLWDAFKYDVLQSLGGISVPAAPQQSGAQMAYELATAVQNLARDQMELESRMHQAAQWAKGIEQRVNALELRLESDDAISEMQAAELALAVKAVAYALEQNGTANGYQRVYGELYRRNGITSYKTLPRARFDAVMLWLKDWHEELIKE